MFLKDDPDVYRQFIGYFNSLKNELLENDSKESLEFIKWSLKKTIDNKKHSKEVKLRKQLRHIDKNSDYRKYKLINDQIKYLLPDNYPPNLKIDDIIHVCFGVGYAGEISEGHYAVILSRKGSMFLIAPITETKQPDQDNNIEVNLNLKKDIETSYINFGQIRYVHFRRIENINGVENGRLHFDGLSEEVFKKWRNIISMSNRNG